MTEPIIGLTKRASIAEVLAFAQKIRAAGGGNPLDALMPAVPEDSESCLIAVNLNFNCEVTGINIDELNKYDISDNGWCMRVDDRDLAKRIGAATGCQVIGVEENEYGNYAIVLPAEIGQVAADFDEAGRLYNDIISAVLDFKEDRLIDSDVVFEDYFERGAIGKVTQEEYQLLKDMLPYISEAVKEAHSLASIVNPDGSIIV